MRFEALGWFLAAISVYAFVVLFSLLKARVIDYSPFDIALGVALGLLVFGLIVTFLGGPSLSCMRRPIGRTSPGSSPSAVGPWSPVELI